MDPTLAWTAVGSVAGVAGVAVVGTAAFAQAKSGAKSGARVTAELGAGQLAQDGVLHVQFASGAAEVMVLPDPNNPMARTSQLAKGKIPDDLGFDPVNAIFVRNRGSAATTVSHCSYVSDFGGTEFKFEPQPAASPRGDHLPKRLKSGQDAVLIHDFKSMRIFLNGVLQDHHVGSAIFRIFIILGDGTRVQANSAMQVRADMSEHEIAASGTRLVRTEMGEQPWSATWSPPRRLLRRRIARDHREQRSEESQ